MSYLEGSNFTPLDKRPVPPEEIRAYDRRKVALRGHNNIPYTQALFREMISSTSKEVAVFTTEKEDHYVNGAYLYSFRRLYLEAADPTDYQAAMYILGDWAHWEKLLNAKQTNSLIEDCRRELELKLRSDAITSLHKIASTGDSKGIAAAKYIAGLEYKSSGKGRPSKAEKEGYLKQEAKSSSELLEDAKRIGLKVVG